MPSNPSRRVWIKERSGELQSTYYLTESVANLASGKSIEFIESSALKPLEHRIKVLEAYIYDIKTSHELNIIELVDYVRKLAMDQHDNNSQVSALKNQHTTARLDGAIEELERLYKEHNGGGYFAPPPLNAVKHYYEHLDCGRNSHDKPNSNNPAVG